ncbi:MAG: HigA family addiction module antitoxin [Hyphomicrobium sp.]
MLSHPERTPSTAALRPSPQTGRESGRVFKRAYERGDSAPLHPGEILREDFLPFYRMTAASLAARLGLPLSDVEELLAERGCITPEIAARLAQAVGLPQRYWQALQMQYDLWHALSDPQGA